MRDVLAEQWPPPTRPCPHPSPDDECRNCRDERRRKWNAAWNPCPKHRSQNQPCRECALQGPPVEPQTGPKAEPTTRDQHIVEAKAAIAAARMKTSTATTTEEQP